jgi:hypothetical protein
MPQTTVISFFKYEGAKPKWQALGRMGRPPLLNQPIEGLTFWKPLGSGSGNGFSVWPDFSTFGLLTVFNNEVQANQFLESDVISEYTEHAINFSHVLMHSIKAHGQWSKQEPFLASATYDESKPVAVITRATIKPKLAYKFWKYVPSVSKSMIGHKGNLLQNIIYKSLSFIDKSTVNNYSALGLVDVNIKTFKTRVAYC